MKTKITPLEYRMKTGRPTRDDILQSIYYNNFIAGMETDLRGKVKDDTREWDSEENN